jgi:hypothetical protein
MRSLWVMVALIAVVLGITGCADKAQPKYDECVALEAKGDLKGAVAACEAPVAPTPASKAGKAAGDKVTTLKAKLKAQEVEAAAKAKAAAAPPPAPPPPPPKPMTGFCAEMGKFSLAPRYNLGCKTFLDPGCSDNNLGVIIAAMRKTIKEVWRHDKRVAVVKVYATTLDKLIADVKAARAELKTATTDDGDKVVKDQLDKDYADFIALAGKWKAAVNAYSGDGDFQAQRDDTDKAWAAYLEHEASRKVACEKLANSN